MHRSKICIRCDREKPIDDFYKHYGMKDGHLSVCKECVKKRVLSHRILNIDRIREYDRERGKKDSRLKNAAAHTKKWRAEDKRRAVAHSAVARAIRTGLLVRLPCEVCGGKSEAHHESYDRPLDVLWLCTVHHKQRHKYLAQNGLEP